MTYVFQTVLALNGLETGDVITEIDGIDASDLSLYDFIQTATGAEGTNASFRLLGDLKGTAREYTRERLRLLCNNQSVFNVPIVLSWSPFGWRSTTSEKCTTIAKCAVTVDNARVHGRRRTAGVGAPRTAKTPRPTQAASIAGRRDKSRTTTPYDMTDQAVAGGSHTRLTLGRRLETDGQSSGRCRRFESLSRSIHGLDRCRQHRLH